MRIAQVSPLFESVPPKGYGGTERVVSYLTEELVEQGHEVTLFASGDSVTRAKLVACCPEALRLDHGCIDSLAHHVRMLEEVFARSAEFDVIHYHIDYLHFPFSKRHPTPALTTLHGRLDLPDLQPLYRSFPTAPVVSISEAQRQPLPWANWLGTVYHGLPTDLYRFHAAPGRYLAFLGRISPEKRADRAIAMAQKAGLPLKIAAKVDRVDAEYFQTTIAPLLTAPQVEFLGEIGDCDKGAFLGQASALLFPVDWPEPFGLVMIEALACGTPVIAYRRGSVPEIITDGHSGVVIDRDEQAAEALQRVQSLPRGRCRQIFEERFSAARMAHDYVALYQKLLPAGTDRGRYGARPRERSVSWTK